MKHQIEETSLEKAARWEGSTAIDTDIILTDHIADIPVPTDARRMNFILVVVCTGGHLQYTLDTKPTLVTAGDMLVVSEHHVVDNYSAAPDVKGMGILMSPEFYHQTISNISEVSAALLFARANPVIRLTQDESDTFCRYFYAIKSRIADTGNRFRRALVSTLLLAMFYDLSNVIYRSSGVVSAGNKRSEEIFTQFIRLVEKNFRRERRVAWYAGQLGLRPKYLSEIIKKVSQSTPNSWIDSYVILELRVMLKNTNKSIKEITDEMHFPNQSFLGKFFKEHVGQSPTDYRKS